MTTSLVRRITPEKPIDLFISGITVLDKKLPACTREDQHLKAAQYDRTYRKKSVHDHFVAYVYGHKTTVQIPIEKHCFLRLPQAWQIYIGMPHFTNQFLDHLLRILLPREHHAYRKTIRGSIVMRRYGVGYKPKVEKVPTADSAEFPFLHIFCSNPFLYSLLRSKFSSKTISREYFKREFYQKLFQGTAANKYLLKWKDPYGNKNRSNVMSDPHLLNKVESKEWFVAHEMDLNGDTMTLSNLGITQMDGFASHRVTSFATKIEKRAFQTACLKSQVQ